MNNDSRARSCPSWLLPQPSWRKQRRGSLAVSPMARRWPVQPPPMLWQAVPSPSRGHPQLKAGVVKLLGRGLSLLRVINSLTAALGCGEWTQTLGVTSVLMHTKSPSAALGWVRPSVQTHRAMHSLKSSTAWEKPTSEPSICITPGFTLTPVLSAPCGSHPEPSAQLKRALASLCHWHNPKAGDAGTCHKVWSQWDPAQPPPHQNWAPSPAGWRTGLGEHRSGHCGTHCWTPAQLFSQAFPAGMRNSLLLRSARFIGIGVSHPQHQTAPGVSLGLYLCQTVGFVCEISNHSSNEKTKQRRSRKSFEEKE